MPDRVWNFRFVSQSQGHRTVFAWRWEARSPDGAVLQSTKAFTTLPDCVYDAQRRGFKGALDGNGGFQQRGYRIERYPDGVVLSPPKTGP